MRARACACAMFRGELYSTQTFLITAGDLGHSDMYRFSGFDYPRRGVAEKVQCKIIFWHFFPLLGAQRNVEYSGWYSGDYR